MIFLEMKGYTDHINIIIHEQILVTLDTDAQVWDME